MAKKLVADTPAEVQDGRGWRKGQTGKLTEKRSKHLTPAEQTTILTMSARGNSTVEISEAIGRNRSVVARFLVKYTDTRAIAKATLNAGAARLAAKIVAGADVRDAIEVLSRPDMDVLKPAVKAGAGPAASNGGFAISVSVDSCGTVVQISGKTGESNGQHAELSGVSGRQLHDSQQLLGDDGKGVIDVSPGQQEAGVAQEPVQRDA